MTPCTWFVESQKQNDTIHNAGMNDVNELKIFLDVVNVRTFARMRRSVRIPIIEERFSMKSFFLMQLIYLKIDCSTMSRRIQMIEYSQSIVVEEEKVD